jgi:hypothetical protein
MTAKTVAALGSLAVVVALAPGCVSFYEIPVETPIHAKLDISGYQRVLIAGFLAGGSKNIDPNAETARLLRSQLRTKSDLKVIDADVMSLVEEVDKQRGVAAASDSDEPRIKNDKDLADYEKILTDAEYWKKIGEDYPGALIVTGSVMFTEVSKSGMVTRMQTTTDQYGKPQYSEVRSFSSMKGFALTPKFVFIDSRTGQQLYSESFHEEALYQEGQNTPALSSYFELMDKLLPGFLNTLSSQKIRGTRILIK